jgi:hypothetical protein
MMVLTFSMKNSALTSGSIRNAVRLYGDCSLKAVVDAPICVPHSPQNLVESVNEAPHSVQNFIRAPFTK